MALSPPPMRQAVLRDDGHFFNPWDRWLQGLYVLVTGRQGARVAISVNAGARKDIDIAWSFPYADANYSASVTVEDTSGAGVGLRVERIRARLRDKITVQIINDAAGVLTGTLHGVAIHD